MVQVLPHVPGFGEKLVDSLINAGGNVAQGLQRKFAAQGLQGILSRLQQPGQVDPNAPVQQGQQAQPQQPGAMREPTLSETAAIAQGLEGLYGKAPADAVLGQLAEQRKFAAKEQIQIRKEERALGQEGVQEFFKKVEQDRIKIPDEELSNEMIKDAIKNGDVDPFSAAHVGQIARDLGIPDSLTTFLETPGSKEFKTGRKTFIGNVIKDSFKGTTSTTEIKLVEDMLAELGATKEANLAAAWGIESSINIRKERLRVADELREQGVSPSKIPAVTDKKIKPYIEELKKEYIEAIRELRKKK